MIFKNLARCILLPVVSSPFQRTTDPSPFVSVRVPSGACLDVFLSWTANVARSCMAHLGQNSSSQLAANSRGCINILCTGQISYHCEWEP